MANSNYDENHDDSSNNDIMLLLSRRLLQGQAQFDNDNYFNLNYTEDNNSNSSNINIDYDELFNYNGGVQENDDFNASGGSNGRILMIIAPIFFLSNSFTAYHVSLGLAYLFLKGEYHSHLLKMLMCPHWIAGIIIPVLVGYSWYGILGAILIAFITIILPYGVCIVHHVRNNQDLRREGGSSSSNSAATSATNIVILTDDNNNNSSNNNSNNNSSNSVDKDKLPPLIYKKVLSKSQKGKNNNRGYVIQKKQQNNDEKENYSFRFNHPKSDIYISAKVNKENSSNNNNNTKENEEQYYDGNTVEEVGLRNNSTTLLIVPLGGGEGGDVDNKSNNASLATAAPAASSSNSVQLCAICLEDYKVGDDIAWSYNPKCHHAFHKDCVLELFKTTSHEECPMCRNTYRYDIEAVDEK